VLLMGAVQALAAPVRNLDRSVERVLRAYHGDTSRFADLMRSALVFDSEPELYAGLAKCRRDFSVRGVHDRFAAPTEHGWRDVLVRIDANGNAAQMGLYLRSMLTTRRDGGHDLYRQSLAISTRRAALAEGAWVLIVDMFQYQVAGEEYLVGPFDGQHVAQEFARRWVRSALEELREGAGSRDELIDLWHVFGEDALLAGGGYAGSAELGFLVDHPGSAQETDWKALRPPHPSGEGNG
jgi:hypothetical protein